MQHRKLCFCAAPPLDDIALLFSPALLPPLPIRIRSGSIALTLLRSLPHVAAGSEAYVTTLSQVGELMIQTHRAYGTIGLGCPETDIMIARLMALGAKAGIYGARMSGGGSGGTVAVLCEKAAIPAVEQLAKEVIFDEPYSGLIQ